MRTKRNILPKKNQSSLVDKYAKEKKEPKIKSSECFYFFDLRIGYAAGIIIGITISGLYACLFW